MTDPEPISVVEPGRARRILIAGAFCALFSIINVAALAGLVTVLDSNQHLVARVILVASVTLGLAIAATEFTQKRLRISARSAPRLLGPIFLLFGLLALVFYALSETAFTGPLALALHLGIPAAFWLLIRAVINRARGSETTRPVA